MEEGVPSPLRVGSPAMARKPSVDQVPSVLRVGSPAVERGTPPLTQRPPLIRQNTSGSDRLSQLFPSRPPSVATGSPDIPSSRRTSYPSPLVPASETSYRIPLAPAPPTFDEDTSYKSIPDPFEQQQHSPPLQNSGTKRLLNRLTSLRSGRSKGGAYNKLEDEESGPSRGHLNDVEETDEPLGYDLSGFDGVPMKKFESKKMASAADAMEQERDLNEAGYAAEFERLEAQLGAGMNSVMEIPFTHQPAQPASPEQGRGHRRGHSNVEVADAAAGEVAQQEAEKTGGIVAVAGKLASLL